GMAGAEPQQPDQQGARGEGPEAGVVGDQQLRYRGMDRAYDRTVDAGASVTPDALVGEAQQDEDRRHLGAQRVAQLDQLEERERTRRSQRAEQDQMAPLGRGAPWRDARGAWLDVREEREGQRVEDHAAGQGAGDGPEQL